MTTPSTRGNRTYIMKSVFLILFYCLSVSLAVAQNSTQTVDNLLLDARYAEALTAIENELAHSADVTQAIMLQNKKAEALIRMGRFEEAERELRTADVKLRIRSSGLTKGTTQANYGLLYLNQGRNDLAADALQKAIDAFEKDGLQNTLPAAQTLAYQGDLYRATGQYAQAEEKLTMTLSIRRKLLPEQHELIAASYNDLGLIASITTDELALDYYDKALAIYKAMHGNDHPKIAIANTNSGLIYRKMELYGDAVNNFESALAIWNKVYPQPHPAKAFVLFNLGETYRKMNDLTATRAFYEKALTMYRESYGDKHPELARVENAMGLVDFSARDYTGALTHYQRALQANIKDFAAQGIEYTPRTKSFYDGNVLLYSLMYKAEALEAMHFGRTLKFTDLTLALRTLQSCDTLIDKLRQQITRESDKLSLGRIAGEVYAAGVRVAHEAATEAFRPEGYRELSFYFAEKSKSAVLLEAISEANAKSFAGIPEALLEEEKTLKSSLALSAQKLAQKPSEAEEKTLRETLFLLNSRYDAFTRKLEQQFPEYFNLKFNTVSPSIAQLQQKLDDHTALLSYFIDDTTSKLYIFLITRKHFRITSHTLDKTFDKYMAGFRNGIFFHDLNVYSKSANELSKVLIPNGIPRSITSLVVLPTGRMSTIPFEALFTREVKHAVDYKSLPYLLNRFTVRYEFSAGLILQRAATAGANATPSILLCAPVTFASETNLPDLPGTEAEVDGIAKLFAGKNLEQSLYTREQAGEKLIKSPQLRKYAYLHFATHGIVDEKNPELSRIYLQPGAASEDGSLFAGEVYALQLNANLVTLSACQTGLGKISKGEGVIGLSRALVYAGARNIMVSFWSVADESTSMLMQDFYGTLLANPTKLFCNDLKTAKQKLVQEGKYSEPYYWAPFVLIGF